MKKILVVFALLAIAATSQAGVIRHDRDDQRYIDLAQQEQFSPVGDLLLLEGNSVTSRCSGTLIHQLYVLTAAHCMDGPNTTGFAFGLAGNGYVFGDEVFFQENWFSSGQNLSSGFDIAIIKLSQAILGVDVAKIYTGRNEVGAVGTHVGYGTTGNGLTGFNQPSGTKRAGNNVIDSDGSDNLFGNSDVLTTDFDMPSTTTDEEMQSGVGFITNTANRGYYEDPLGLARGIPGRVLDLEYLISPGDSGGGLFIEENGEWYLAGVHSFGTTFDEW